MRRSVRRATLELGDEGAGTAPVGEDGDAVATAGDRDVEDAALLLLVGGEAMGHDAVGHAEHRDAVPLPALDAMDGRQRDAGGVRLAREHAPQPRLEAT